jgi:hypothetical protein
MVRGRASETNEGSCIGQGCAFLGMIGGDWAKARKENHAVRQREENGWCILVVGSGPLTWRVVLSCDAQVNG